MRKPLISVVVTIYNTMQYLQECLNSIVKQSYRDFEIILVDDGSWDGSEILCDKYAASDSRIKVIHQKNAGLVNARKTGLREAEGEYIYYIDADDWIDCNIIQGFVDILTDNFVDMISVGIKREYGSTKCSIDPVPFNDGLYVKDNIRSTLVPKLINTDKFFEWGQQLTYWHYLIKKDLLIKNLPVINDQIRMAEDVVCVYPCILDADSIYIKSDIFYHYRQRNDSMKWSENPNEYENLQLVYKTLMERFCREPEAALLVKKAKYLLIFELLTSVVGKLESNDEVFPYEDFPKGSRIVVYGAGLFGNRVISMIRRNQYADVVAWVDKNYEKYQSEGVDVISPDALCTVEYDYVIIAVIRADIRQSIVKKLADYNVPVSRIINIDLAKIENVQLPK